MNAAAFKASYADWKLIKTRSVIQVVLEIPLEQADLAYQVLGGMPLPASEQWVAIARLDSGASAPESEVGALDRSRSRSSSELGAPQVVGTSLAPDIPHKPRRPVAADKRLAQQAGICCADPVFQQFLFERRCITAKCEEEAAKFIRDFCQVGSRSEITPGSRASDLWDNLHGRFLAWKLVDAA